MNFNCSSPLAPSAPPSSPIGGAFLTTDPSSPGPSIPKSEGTVEHESVVTTPNGVKRITKRTYVDGKRVEKSETIVIPDNIAALADCIDDDEDGEDDDSSTSSFPSGTSSIHDRDHVGLFILGQEKPEDIDWSPPPVQSAPSFLGNVSLNERSRSELSLSAPVVIEASSSITTQDQLILPKLQEISVVFDDEDEDGDTEASQSSSDLHTKVCHLRRFATPPRVDNKTDDTILTVDTESPSPPSSPETHRLSPIAGTADAITSPPTLSTLRIGERKTKTKKVKNFFRRLSKRPSFTKP